MIFWVVVAKENELAVNLVTPIWYLVIHKLREGVITIMYFIVCGVGRDRGFLRPHPTTASPLPNPYAFTHVIITSPSPHYRQVTTLIPQRHIRAPGIPIFKGAWTFFPFLLMTDVAIGKGRQHHLVFLGGVVSLAALFVCCASAASREREGPKHRPSKDLDG